MGHLLVLPQAPDLARQVRPVRLQDCFHPGSTLVLDQTPLPATLSQLQLVPMCKQLLDLVAEVSHNIPHPLLVEDHLRPAQQPATQTCQAAVMLAVLQSSLLTLMLASGT
jgi:hypothetical protein